MYVYVYVCMCMCVYIYIYTHMYFMIAIEAGDPCGRRRAACRPRWIIGYAQ